MIDIAASETEKKSILTVLKVQVLETGNNDARLCVVAMSHLLSAGILCLFLG